MIGRRRAIASTSPSGVRPARLLRFGELTSFASAGSATYASGGDEWTLVQTRSSGGGSNASTWYTAPVPPDCINERGEVLLLCEVDRPAATSSATIYAGIYDGSDTTIPYTGCIRNPAGTGGGANYTVRNTVTTPADGSPGTIGSGTFDVLSGEPVAWMTRLALGDASTPPSSRTVPIWRYGTDSGVLDPTGRDITPIWRQQTQYDGAIGAAASSGGTISARAPVGDPQLVLLFGSGSSAALTHRYRVLLLRPAALGGSLYAP